MVQTMACFNRPQPRTVPPGYVDLFGKLDRARALRVAAFIQREAVDSFGLVEVAIMRAADAEGISERTAWRYLRAGRWLIEVEGAQPKKKSWQ